MSFASILFRFFLTVSAALVLISTSGFDAVCLALERLRLPRVFTVQLMLLYRYIFVLLEEASRMWRAWTLRSGLRRKMPFRVFRGVAGQLLLRSVDRAQRIHLAMVSRGFTGEIHSVRRLQFGYADTLFVVVWTAYFVLCRAYNLPAWLGQTVLGVLS